MVKLYWVINVDEKHYALYRRIGLKVNYYRRLRGLTQEQLSEIIGKDTTFLAGIEAPNVHRGLSLDTLFDIAAALDVAPYKFLFDDDKD